MNISARRYQDALKRRGFKWIGGGLYGEVYAKPGSDRVIKVGSSGERDGWLAYASFCMNFPSPYAPKIYSIHWHGDGDYPPYYVAVIERLAKTVRQWRDDDRNRNNPGKNYERACNDANSWLRGGGATSWQTEETFPGLKDFMRDLRTLYKGRAHFDLHDHNAMISADGRLVITDPFSSYEAPDDGYTITSSQTYRSTSRGGTWVEPKPAEPEPLPAPVIVPESAPRADVMPVMRAMQGL